MIISGASIVQATDRATERSFFRIRQIQHAARLNICQSRTARNVDGWIQSAASPHMNNVGADVRRRYEYVASDLLLDAQVPLILVCRLRMRRERIVGAR